MSELVEKELEHCKFIQNLEKRFSAPMFWIGIYVGAVSLICSLSMTTDVLRGFHHRKFWFPCKFFTLNATSLTLLGVAMKLPLDLSGYMPRTVDLAAKLSGLVFMCISMANFMPSLGPMGTKELRTNVTALGILVITVAVNVFIQLYTGAIWYYRVEHAVVTSLMLLLFVIISFSALTIPISKQVLEMKYLEKHKMEEPEKSDEFSTLDKLKDQVKKYWIMAESGGPQFVIARTATCSASAAISFLTILILLKSWTKISFPASIDYLKYTDKYVELDSLSDYKWSTFGILCTQSIGAVIGAIAPGFRWFMVISSKSSKKGIKRYYRNVFKVENYWIQLLVQWKGILLGLGVRARVCRKLVHNTKNMILDICIGVQMAIVVASKMVRLVPICIKSIVLLPYYCCRHSNVKPLLEPKTIMVNQGGSESGASAEVDFSRYVLQLEGNEELPKRIVKNISNSANQLILVAQKQQPKNLMELLDKFAGFKGAAEFEDGRVPRLHSNDKPKVWSMELITVTSIAVAIPDVKNDSVNQLLSSVREGFKYVRIIEKSLDAKGDLLNMRSAADVVWLGVELHRKWLDDDLQKMARKGKTFGEILQMLGDNAKERDTDFKRRMSEDSEGNQLNWPVKVIAANSMYKICQTMVTEYQASKEETYEKLFKKLSVMIVYILCDCLTNLPQVISVKCCCSEIERREHGVQQAARLLGETEEIMKILQQHKFLPSLDLDAAAASV